MSLVAISRAPLPKLQIFARRMGRATRWRSSFDSDFNRDFGVSFTKEELKGRVNYNFEMIDGDQAFDELPGISVFYKNEKGDIFHTYSTYARGGDILLGA